MTTNNTKLSTRIDVADVLRGLAIAGILLIHSIEHFNFYVFPKADSQWLAFADKATWDALFFLLAGKAYAVFALLFGFSFYIQDSNAMSRGIDFRMRFLWRLVLLFLFGQINAAFFTAEVLVLYALVGFVLPLFARSSNRLVLVAAIVLLLQPMEWGRMIYAILNPDYVAPPSLDSQFWSITVPAQKNANFLEMLRVNLWEGQLASLAWALENARFSQTPALFLFGLFIGRTKMFHNTLENGKLWMATFFITLALFFPLYGLNDILPTFVENKSVLKPALLIVSSLHKFCFMSVLVSAVILLYYSFPKMQLCMNKMIPYGKMSLTNYITQSMIGSFLFYNWGLKLNLGAFYSFLVGLAILVVQYWFCRWWMKNHQHGPLEYLWKKATWISLKK